MFIVSLCRPCRNLGYQTQWGRLLRQLKPCTRCFITFSPPSPQLEPGVRSTPPVLLWTWYRVAWQRVWGRKGEPSSQLWCHFPSFLCPPQFFKGGGLLLLFFRFSVRVLASHRFTTGVVLLVLLCLLELGSRIGKANGGQRKCRAKSLLPCFSFFLTKNCVNAVLSSHVECSHLILYQSYVTSTEFSSL